jgi:hypothetical protein
MKRASESESPALIRGGHSAIVKMWLVLDDRSIPVAQMGPDFLLLDAPFDYPPGNAGVILQVDQSERRWDVRLPDGISAACQRVSVRRAGPTISKAV